LTIASEFAGHPHPEVLERVGYPPFSGDVTPLEPSLLSEFEVAEGEGDPRDSEGGFFHCDELFFDCAEEVEVTPHCPLPAECSCSANPRDGSVDPHLWSAMEEVERLLLILEHHAQALPDEHPPIDSALLHALVHHTAERALDEGDSAARRDLAALMRRGISRHKAIHRIGQRLLAEQLPGSCR
jgi:hypothetical protein